MKKIVYLIFGLLISNVAQAGFYTAGDIQKSIDAYDRVALMRGLGADAQESAVMMGYVTATADFAVSNGWVCIPAGATIRQLVAVVRNYLNANPSTWANNGTTVISAALIQAFPCKK